ERSGLAALTSGETAGPLERIRPQPDLVSMARSYGALQDPDLRAGLLDSEMLKRAYLLTQKRTVEESQADVPGAATSIFKFVEAEYVKAQLELQMEIRGFQGLGWGGDSYSDEELAMTRLWLEAKSISIAGGSNEVQLNIIAKRVLGLPDT
ncbi:MAG: acyl-CoA dehydrogenase family protein, partial [Pseudomonadota bacterium]